MQFHTAYNLPYSSAAGKPQTIAIVDAYDDPNAGVRPRDLRAQFGLPAVHDRERVLPQGEPDRRHHAPRPPNSGWAAEISLDLDMARAICPNCHILLVEATTNSLSDLGAAGERGRRARRERRQQQLRRERVLRASSSDEQLLQPPRRRDHRRGRRRRLPGVGFPAASPYVTAVGGTTLNLATHTATRGATETVWSGTG